MSILTDESPIDRYFRYVRESQNMAGYTEREREWVWNEVAKAEQSVDFVKVVEEARHVLSSGYGCGVCREDDLGLALGMQTGRTDHAHI